MFRKRRRFFFLSGILSMAVLCWLTSCQKPRLILPPSQSSKFGIYLTDSRSNYQAVWISIQQIFIYVANDALKQSGWIEVPMTRQGLYNLLNFQDGKDTLIAQADIPPGTISQIRLILGNNNSLILNNGSVFPLQAGYSLSNGIQLNIQDTLQAGAPFSLDINFNTASSITGPNATGQYTLQPVINVLPRIFAHYVGRIAFLDPGNGPIKTIIGKNFGDVE
ncbi:MAG: DUF4382 domain-containing protein [Chitinophagaceae bacterium]|nr:MAG: DUF4382 domain-containing protein [Chitinophagaceae bacterium]